MRVLLDECLPKKLKRELKGRDVFTVPEMGWAGVKNGELLRLAAEEFDVLLTSDQNLEQQQNLGGLDLAILVLVALSNDIDLLRPLMPKAREVLAGLRPGNLLKIESSVPGAQDTACAGRRP